MKNKNLNVPRLSSIWQSDIMDKIHARKETVITISDNEIEFSAKIPFFQSVMNYGIL